MIIEELHLEITRNCTLYCEHCLRGDKECVSMSLNTLDNVFKNIDGIDVLLLTGGEPLIAINQLEKLVEIIRNECIRIGVIRFITNGTIMSARVLRVLKELSELTKLDIKVSADIFHQLEVERLGFVSLRDKNFKILSDYFGATKYGDDSEEPKYTMKQMIYAIGRAKDLSQDRLEEINKMVHNPYVTNDYFGIHREVGRPVFLLDDSIGGQLTIDVYGNLVGYGLEFKEEDTESYKIRANINNMSLVDATQKYIDFIAMNMTEEEIKLNKLLSD